MKTKPLDPKQVAEVFNILSEECAEVIQCVSKINRFGIFSSHPDTPSVTNLDHLTEELGDLLCMIDLLVGAKFLDRSELDAAAEAKKKKLSTWSKIDVDSFK